MFNLDMKNLEESLKEAKKKMDQFGNKINSIINPFLDEKLSRKEVVEICHVGKFIAVWDETIQLVEKRESPDFVVNHQGEKIGLEVERIFNHKEVENIKSKQGLFESAAQKFQSQYPQFKLLANFGLTDNFQIKGNKKSDLIKEINEYMFAKANKNILNKPSFITGVDIMPHTGVSFNFVEGVYMATDITETTIKDAIEKKELKFNKYKEHLGTERQWLLLVIGIGSDSYNIEIEELEFTEEIESQFEHIYLLEDFDAKVIEIK